MFHPELKNKLAPETALKAAVFIDDGNMFYAQKKAGWRVDYNKLRNILSDNFRIDFMNYYLVVPNQKDTAFIKTEKFINWLKKEFSQSLTLRFKPLKYIFDRENKSWIKKGNVDSEILIDVLANIDNFDVAVIVSGDSDYRALANVLIAKSKKVIFIGFENNMAWELRQMKHLYLNRIRDLVEFGNKKAPEKTGVPLLDLVYGKNHPLSSKKAK